MRWYFAIDEGGSDGDAGLHARLAVRSAALAGTLEPRLLYHGARNEFTRWMERHGVTVIDAEPPCLDAMRVAEARGAFRAHSLGHWLRLAIPLIDRDADFALYTDCDIAFLRPVDWGAIRPRVFAAAPEFAPDVWNYFNSGVMVLNLAALRSSQPAFETVLRARFAEADARTYDDQVALNQAFRGHWDRLDPGLNAKPYWPHDPRAGVLHFHGPKLGGIEAIADRHWNWSDPTSRAIGALCDAHVPRYVAWLTDLGERMQMVDIGLALRLHRVAGRLAAYQRTNAPRTHDLTFMRAHLFAD
ncbi:hypothetical protein AiwAL_10850 [Acidiphilium sp. AL]|uniref:Uncharacterized protein n=1 Tax=Acidiphilium iwatense TaxID=768198 RepID=A0ABS9DWJ9_9PROT|nr:MULTISPECIES: hypothetical protein [Acidiphilium]MCF3947117.1 hypothetical protein [Acidiphilium iwatense]MCU4160600.1 hypothetical protein [Acidiphilium sp. AL]